ncbi:vacuolar-type H+-ATPase subunit I/STV1 [Acidovorax soli]|uniref:Vacuolar-type H+-ATPase subunit I/STV1 n=1 Tax=Acidovorax soli TaxID=592050 RepID=A0A7X0U9J5_9BURK|nr:hypothetical protein [Acidovorax soli]MBB6559620.1 vacuolar-type H+-ATPase subunit I/STV1 [Acidovorax soli]
MSQQTIEAQPQAGAVETTNSKTALAALRKTALAELSVVDAGLAALRRKYRNKLFAVGTAEGMAAARKARMDLRERRYKVPKIVDEQKAAIRQVATDVGTEGERIVAALLELESPIHEQIKAEEDRRAEAKQAKEREEREAMARIDAVVDAIIAKPTEVVGLGSDVIGTALTEVEAIEVTLETFGDHAGRVEAVKNSTIERLETMHAAALAHEQEAKAQAQARAKLAAEREQMEREQREHNERMAAQRAELDRLTLETQAQAQAIERQAVAQREQAERIERERLQRITDVSNRISDITALPATHAASTALQLESAIRTLNDTLLTAAYFDDRVPEAEQAKHTALEELRQLHRDVAQREADAAIAEACEREEAAIAEARRLADDAKRANANQLYDALANLLTCAELRGDVCVQTALLMESARHAIEKSTPAQAAQAQ